MDVDTLSELKHQYPQHTAIIERLYGNYQVIVCSAHFKYNLKQMMLVIINKLGKEAIARFSEFVKGGTLNRMPFSQAKKYYNIVITDQMGRKIFDFAGQRL